MEPYQEEKVSCTKNVLQNLFLACLAVHRPQPTSNFGGLNPNSNEKILKKLDIAILNSQN